MNKHSNTDNVQNLPLSISEITLLCSMVDGSLMSLERSKEKATDPLDKKMAGIYIEQAKGIRDKLSKLEGAW